MCAFLIIGLYFRYRRDFIFRGHTLASWSLIISMHFLIIIRAKVSKKVKLSL
jgi:hypothetical protein